MKNGTIVNGQKGSIVKSNMIHEKTNVAYKIMFLFKKGPNSIMTLIIMYNKQEVIK